MRVKRVLDRDGHFYGVAFHCPGCRRDHLIPTRLAPAGMTLSAASNIRNIWTFDDDYTLPTLFPAVLVRVPLRPEDPSHGCCGCRPVHCRCRVLRAPFVYTCHSFVRDGQIQYLPGTTNPYAGRLLWLPEYADDTPLLYTTPEV